MGSILGETFGAINQIKLKRLLGYGMIIQMGMPIITLSLFSKEHVEPTLLYILIYVIGFLGAALLMKFYNKEKFNYLNHLLGLRQFNVIIAISWSLPLL